MAKVQEAHRYMESDEQVGKIVMTDAARRGASVLSPVAVGTKGRHSSILAGIRDSGR